jgi:hypothetical protein
MTAGMWRVVQTGREMPTRVTRSIPVVMQWTSLDTAALALESAAGRLPQGFDVAYQEHVKAWKAKAAACAMNHAARERAFTGHAAV